jgi:hypothetical protein
MVGHLADEYPFARTIHLVMDNLNTHRRKSLVDYFGEQEGHQRIQASAPGGPTHAPEVAASRLWKVRTGRWRPISRQTAYRKCPKSTHRLEPVLPSAVVDKRWHGL